MAANERALKHHRQLFPGYVSKLAGSDPELIEFFDNFAFDEVFEHAGVDLRTRLMVQLAAIIACQAVRDYRMMLGAALTAGITPVEAKARGCDALIDINPWASTNSDLTSYAATDLPDAAAKLAA